MIYLIRAAGYIAIVALYGFMDWLNLVQAGKSGFLGTLAILTVTSWTTRKGPEGRSGRAAAFITFLLFEGIIAFQAFLRDVFGVAQDDSIVIEALFNTDSSEAFEFVLQNSRYLGKHLALLIGLAVFFWFVLRAGGSLRSVLPRYRSPVPAAVQTPGRGRRALPIVLTSLLLLVHFNPTTRRENPLLYFPLRYAKWQRNLERVEELQGKILAAMEQDRAFADLTYRGDGPRTVVFVLGESTTRLNWSMYGYSRRTTPELESLGEELLKFRDVVTTKASTVGDIQLIMGPATRERPKLYESTPDLLAMAGKAGYKTFWITNHSTDMTGTLAILAKRADVTVNVNKGGSRGEGSHDAVALPELETALKDPAPNKFIVLHLLGAHPAFYFRYPEQFARFNEADDEVARLLKEAGRSYVAISMRNYYDNAMLYTDHILKRTIDLCRESGQPVAWLFVPDHGEDVAHYDNFVGHNHRVLSMYEIPMLVWRSPTFPEFANAASDLTGRPYQTDLLDHTLLSLMGISGEYYDPARDVLSPDFQPYPRMVNGKPYPGST